MGFFLEIHCSHKYIVITSISNLDNLDMLLSFAGKSITNVSLTKSLNNYRFVLLCLYYGGDNIFKTQFLPTILFKHTATHAIEFFSEEGNGFNGYFKYINDMTVAVRTNEDWNYIRIYGFN